MHITVINVKTAQSLEDCMHKGNWIILYYANWCGHCKVFKPEWERLKSMVPEHINTAEIESEMIPQMPNKPQIQGFPTMKLYSNNKDIGDYNGERSGKAILTHLEKSMKASKSKKSNKSLGRKMKMATPGLMTALMNESKKLKALLKKTKVLNPARMSTPSQAARYLQRSLRRSMRK
jgi:thiol-disulfide isomerase/thioredoxin